VDDSEVLSLNPVMRADAVLLLDICPYFSIMLLRGIRFKGLDTLQVRLIKLVILGHHRVPWRRATE
jgi:hypothetical protein